jgi:tetratricopeptide (TPR) repeat protein
VPQLDKVRIVICQIESHPAFYIGRLAFPEEPFVPPTSELSLGHLSSLGVEGVTTLQEHFKSTYLKWSFSRLNGILRHPLLNEDVLTVILFPEGGVHVQELPTVNDYVKTTQNIVVAGSHTIQDTEESKRIYKSLGKSPRQIISKGNQASLSVIFSQNKISTRKKQILSPFERTDISSLTSNTIKVAPILTSSPMGELRILPLICADALQNPSIKGDFDLATIVSYTPKPNQFNNYVNTIVDKAKVAAYCNDGAFGGSKIALPLDIRRDSWFFKGPLGGHLPPGDILAVFDIPLGIHGTEVGVVNPQNQIQIKLLSFISYSLSSNKIYLVTKELNEISKLQDNNARYRRLSSLIDKQNLDIFHEHRIRYLADLARNGIDVDYWDIIGNDLIIKQYDLRKLESSMADNCTSVFYDAILDGDNGERHNSVISFSKQCKNKSLNKQLIPKNNINQTSKKKPIILNRDNECEALLSCFDSRDEHLVKITGLPAIGKSAVVHKALEQTAFNNILKIQLAPSSTIEFINAKISGLETEPTTTSQIQQRTAINESKLRDSIASHDIIWLESSEQLLSSANWRSREIENYIDRIINLAIEEETFIIFESTINLPLDLIKSHPISRIHVKGFERENALHGVSLLNQQLRKLSLDPKELSEETKIDLVNKLGGHPLAIILCAYSLNENGLSHVLNSLKSSSGFYLRVINKILQNINLTEAEELILRLLSGSSIDVPRDLIAQVCNFPTVDVIRNLARQSLIDISSINNITIPGILRNRFQFSEISENLQNNFHRGATKFYSRLTKEFPGKIEYAIAAEFHSTLSGEPTDVKTGFIDSNFAQTQKLYDDRQFDKAAKLMEEIIQVKKSEDVLRLASLIFAEIRQYDRALKFTKKVFEYNQTDSFLFRDLSKIFLKHSREDIAEKLVLIAQGTKIYESSIFMVQGQIARRKNNLSQAQWYYEEAVKANRNSPWPFFYLGEILLKQGLIEEAITILHQGLVFCERRNYISRYAHNAIKNKLGLTYLLNNDLDLASPLIESLVDDSPNNPEIIQAYALLIVKRDGIDHAEDAFRKFRKVKPRTWKQKGQYNLLYGILLLHLNKVSEANECFALAHRYEPNNVYYMIKYAKSLYSIAKNHQVGYEQQLSHDTALKCANIIKAIKKYDPDNHVARRLEEDLYIEFDIQLSKI